MLSLYIRQNTVQKKNNRAKYKSATIPLKIVESLFIDAYKAVVIQTPDERKALIEWHLSHTTY